MNQNIEVINPKLWAVRFSLIPFISEINYECSASDNIPIYEEPLRITTEGLLILNKDYKIYNSIKSKIIEVMRLKDKKLNKKLELLKNKNYMNPSHIIEMFVLQAEFERRCKERGNIVNGYNKNCD